MLADPTPVFTYRSMDHRAFSILMFNASPEAVSIEYCQLTVGYCDIHIYIKYMFLQVLKVLVNLYGGESYRRWNCLWTNF